MTKNNQIILDGNSLTTHQLSDIINDSKLQVSLSDAAKKRVLASHEFLKQALAPEHDNLIIYGINTGFGPMATHILPASQLLELQKNLIRSHAVGMGESIKPEFVLAAMVVRFNTLAKGYSGVSVELLDQLKLLINKRIIPLVPEHGAVGTSGDLVQLSHIALTVIGEGQVFYKKEKIQTKKLFRELGIKPYSLKPKEGLGLINGTAAMSGIGSLLTIHAENLLNLEVQLGALSLELVNAYSDSISAELHQARPHTGQIYIAKKLRELLSSSELLSDRKIKTSQYKTATDVKELPEAVQEVYSLRCLAQILGPIQEILEKSKNDLTIEINSATDNPLISVTQKRFLHGGNFHGDYVAASLDQLKASLVKLTMLSERRTNYFLNSKINGKFPPFMNLNKPGLTLGLQGLQFVATSTTAYNQSLAFPHHIHSIPTNGDNQDIVSMGTDAALITAKVIENAYIVLSIELATLLQGVDFLKIKAKLSNSSKKLYNQTREIFPAVMDDRELHGDLAKLLGFVKKI